MLYGKTVVITGVASGIGARTAALAESLGAEVIGIDLRKPSTPLSAFIEADLSSLEAIEKLVENLPDRVDALCNIAGVSGKIGAARTLAVNFYGLRAVSEKIAPRIRNGGAVVNAASIAGFGWRTNLERAKNLAGVQGFPDTVTLVKEFGIKDEESYPVSKEVLLLWTFRAAHQPLFRESRHTRQCGQPRPGRDADPRRVPDCVGRCARGQRHIPRRPCGPFVRCRAGDSLPVLGWRSLDQRRQPARRWWPRSLDKRRRARLLTPASAARP